MAGPGTGRSAGLRPASLVIVAAVALLVLAPKAAQARGSRKIKLHEATGKVKPTHDHITFDPLVQEVEMHKDDEAWEREYEKEHHEKHHVQAGHHSHHDEGDEDGTVDEWHDYDAEHDELLHEAGVDDPDDLQESDLDNVDLAKRIDVLFPLIDVEPKDDKITLTELAQWELMQYHNLQEHRMERELEALDEDGDGLVTLKEYMHDDSPGDKVKDWKEYPESERDYYRQEMERFEIMDSDHDGKINHHELYMVLHPEESGDPLMQAHNRKWELKNHDANSDGKLDLEEFMDGVYTVIHDTEEEDYKWAMKEQGKPYKVSISGAAKRKKGHMRFKELDGNNDGFIDVEEIAPVMHFLLPGEEQFSVQTARHLMEQADEDGDCKLTLQEMHQHKDVFYEVERSRDGSLPIDHETATE